jgi:hypothetical protein
MKPKRTGGISHPLKFLDSQDVVHIVEQQTCAGDTDLLEPIARRTRLIGPDGLRSAPGRPHQGRDVLVHAPQRGFQTHRVRSSQSSHVRAHLPQQEKST